MDNLAATYQEKGDFGKAERILCECLSIRLRKQPSDWKTFRTQSDLGASLFGQKNYAAAESLLVAGYEGMKPGEAALHESEKSYMREALERLVQLYEAWDKPEQAKLWRQKLQQPNALKKESAK